MSSEPPPYPITTTFNEKDWIPATSGGSSTTSINTKNTNITADETTNASYYPTFVSATSGYKPQLVDSGMTYNPSTNTLTVGTLIGATSGTVTNAVTSQNVVVALGSSNTDYYPTFVSASTGASLPILADSALKYNPFTDTLTVGTLIGTVSGSISNAVTSQNVVVALGSSNTDYYPNFTTSYTGASLPEFADQDFKYNPSTNTLTVGTLSASTINGTVSTATNALNVYNSGITTAGNYSIPYLGSNTVGNTTLSSDVVGSHLTFNPNTNTLSTRNLTVPNTATISGTGTALSLPNATAISAPNATITASSFSGNASNSNAVTVTTSGSSTPLNVTFVNGTTGSLANLVTSNFTYTPSSNTVTATSFSGTATNANNMNVTSSSSATPLNLALVDGTSGYLAPLTNNSLTYTPSTNTLSVGTLTATTINGAVTTATNASYIYVAPVSVFASYFPTFVSGSTGENKQVYLDADINYNPSNNTLTVPNLTVSGTLTGTVSNAATASTATGLTVTTTSVDVDFNPIFVANSGSGVTPITDIDIKWNPSTNLLTVPNLTVSNTLTGTVSNATNATNMNVNNYTTSAGSFYPTFVAGTGNASSGLDTDLQYTPSTNTLNVVNLTASGTITGSFGGTIADATNAANVYVTPSSTAANFYPTFVSTNTAGNKQEFLDTDLTYNPSTNTLTAGNIIATGTLSGTFSGTISDATNAANVYVTPTSTAANFYPTFVSTNTAGNKQEFLDTDLTYNPSTNTLTSTNVVSTTSTSTNIASTSTTGTLTIGSNLTTGGTLTLGNTGCGVTLAGKNPTLNYAYPASSPSQLGWSQLVRSGFNVTFGTTKRTYGANTTALVAGIYSIRYFIYIPDDYLPTGQRMTLTLVANPTAMTNGGTVYTDTGEWSGYSINNRVAVASLPTVLTGSFIFDNTGTIATSSVYPYWAVTLEPTANSGSISYWDTYFVRIA